MSSFRHSRLLAAVLACVLPLHANAFDCAVQVRRVLLYKDGGLHVLHSGNEGYIRFCNMNTNYDGVSPAVCAAWYAKLLLIKKNGGTAQLYYSGTPGSSEGPVTSCALVRPMGQHDLAPTYVGDISPPN